MLQDAIHLYCLMWALRSSVVHMPPESGCTLKACYFSQHYIHCASGEASFKAAQNTSTGRQFFTIQKAGASTQPAVNLRKVGTQNEVEIRHSPVEHGQQ